MNYDAAERETQVVDCDSMTVDFPDGQTSQCAQPPSSAATPTYIVITSTNN